MAQSGFTPIVLYHSTTATTAPLAADLNAGELAININDEKLYFKNSTGIVKLLASSAATTNVSSITFGSTGLTPNTATTGAVTVAGTLAIANGGTGSTSTTYCSLTANVTGTLPVANGGTGAVSQTAYAVLCGGTTTTGAFQSIASVGTAAQVLTSNGAGALPTFQTPAAGGTTIPSGTVMLFGQTSAPTGFTKLLTNDNSALRVVTGTASTGGSVGFTTAFASQTPTGSVSITTVSGSAGATTLTTPQIPSHSHVITGKPTDLGSGPITNCVIRGTNPPLSSATDNTGGGDSHTHPFSFSSGSGTFTGNAINLAVQYIDVIRATKD